MGNLLQCLHLLNSTIFLLKFINEIIVCLKKSIRLLYLKSVIDFKNLDFKNIQIVFNNNA
jgi:hypothetical protein